MAKSKERLWAVYNQEGQAVALTVAKTEGGAKKKWEVKTGGHRSEIYVETVNVEDGYFGFTPLI